jgi:hypothetical protein
MFETPILLILFNRPDCTQIVFNRIKEIKPTKLYVAADGPRNIKLDDVKLCEDTRKIVEKIDWNCEVKTLFQNKNLGCRIGPENAINWFFENEEMGIILEDDCLPNLDFFKYCNELLSFYKEDQRIMAITGRNSLGKYDSENSYFFSRLFREWGWATWKRAWILNKSNDNELRSPSVQAECNDLFEDIVKCRYYKNCLNSVIFENHDAWDYVWAMRILLNNGLVIVPKVNLVENIGLRSGTHFGSNVNIKRELYDIEAFPLEMEIIHPSFVFANTKYDNLSFENLFPYLYAKKKYSILKRLIDSINYRIFKHKLIK